MNMKTYKYIGIQFTIKILRYAINFTTYLNVICIETITPGKKILRKCIYSDLNVINYFILLGLRCNLSYLTLINIIRIHILNGIP